MITKKSYENCLSVRQMFFKNLFLLFFFFVAVQQVNAQRAMYVTLAKQTSWGSNASWTSNIFDNTGTVPTELIDMLEYARDNHVTYLILYKVTEVMEANHTEGLENFMRLAKSDYCITKFGVNVYSGSIIGNSINDNNDLDPLNDYLESYNSGDDLITLFNSDPTHEVKFDALVCESEFWNSITTNPAPDIFPSFEVYLQLLEKMNNMKETATGPEAMPVSGITEVDVYLMGSPDFTTANPPVAVETIFEECITNNYSVLENVNRVDNLADNIFIACYQLYSNSLNSSGTYHSYRHFKTLAALFGNTVTGSTPQASYKTGTKLFPLFAVNSSLNASGGFSNNYTKSYFDADPTLALSKTPEEIENEFFNFFYTDPSANTDNVVSSSNVAWFKYEFMPKPTNYSGHTNYNPNYYTANNILFSSNPTQVCNEVTFDYSGPNEDGMEYIWDFGDGSQTVTGVTNASNQLESTSDNTHAYAENGTYTVSLTLVYPGGCSYTYSIDYELIITGTIPDFNVSSSNVTDCDYNDGVADVEILSNPNFGPFTYLWNDENSSTTSSIINLPMNEYTVKVTNNQGCVAFGSTVIGNGMITFRPNAYEVNVNETWSSTTAMPILLLKGVVYINSGAILTIDNATVQFAYDVIEDNDEEELTGARFQVNEGGTLKVINSTLTGCNEGIWDGIESRGSIDNSSLTQLNNATIKNAKIGVTNDRRNNFQKNLLVGGIIKAENSQFINNRLGVELKHGDLNSYFKDCYFDYNSASLFNFPANTEIAEWRAQEMTFVHLKDSRRIRFDGNIFFTNDADFQIAKRGTGIFSESSIFDLGSSSSDGNNTFKNLTKGIEKIESFGNLGRLIAIGNTFTNIPYGITVKSGFSDVIQENTFTNIPSSDIINNATYGIFMIGSSGFNLTGNTFVGNSSTNSSAFGSHGIAFENSGSIASTCFDNHFRGTDYGVHTQGNNMMLKIRCNVFSEDGIDHNESGIYVYDGILKNQGTFLCGTNPSEAAGNTWLGPKDAPGESITSAADEDFLYYANPSDAFQSTVTMPDGAVGSIIVNPSSCAATLVSGGDCSSSTAGLGVFGSASWYDGIHVLISDHRDKIKYYKFVYDYLLDNKDDSLIVSLGDYDSLLNLVRESIEWNVGEKQLFENELMQAYWQDEKFDELEELLIKAESSESYKLLSIFYVNIKDYKKCRQALDSISSIFKQEESQYMESKAKNELKQKELKAFIQYLSILLDLAENDLTIHDVTPKQYDVLKYIIEQKVQISVMAESDLFAIDNSLFEHSIYKQGGEKSMKVIASSETSLISNFSIFPNPTNGSLTVKCFLPENSNINSIFIYDAIGKLKKSVNIESKGDVQIKFDCSEIANGVYNCHVVSDKQTINTSKIVIVK